uniref:ANF_receptor domain-containing protein n=1 Tax=Angiostrongylus cantonensis TaxID=6313 RepID=A0A0K0DHY2_ANGCA
MNCPLVHVKMWCIIVIYAILTSQIVTGLSCKPRAGGTPVPIGVFMTSVMPNSLDKKPFDVVPAIKLALNFIQNHSCILNGFKLELIYKDTKYAQSGFDLSFQPLHARPSGVVILTVD